MNYEEARKKYPTDGDFVDPVVRCDGCNKPVLLKVYHKQGACPLCGSRKCKTLRAFTEEERQWILKQDIDPLFLQLFQQNKEVSDE